MRMKLVIPEIFILFSANIYFVFALSCQEGKEDLFHNYDSLKLAPKSAEKVNTFRSLKLLSDKDRNSVIEYEIFLPASINSALLDILSEASSSKCVEDFKYVQKSLDSRSDWSMKMLDSYGKPGSGILEGNLIWPGQYDECISVQAPSKENTSLRGFQGEYCTFQVPFELEPVSQPIIIGVCLPDSCKLNRTNFNLNDSSLDAGKILESAFSNVTLICKATSRKLTSGAIFVMCLLSVFALMAAIGSFITVLEYYMKKNVSKDDTRTPLLSLGPQKEKCKSFFNCFCIFTNGEKLLNTAKSEGQIPCLHGIRFLSMNWVILLHTYMYMVSLISNSDQVINSYSRWSLIFNSDFSVDSFFVLSAFLVGFSYFQKAEKTGGKISWLNFYIHRYIRLTPVYMIVLAFYTTISPFLGSGPFWPDYNVIPICKVNWWRNMLYINNFQTKYDQCMGWTWYLADDMQFYVISPLFLITLWRRPKVGYSLLGLFFCITFAWNFGVTYENYGIYSLLTRDLLFGNINKMSYSMANYIDILYVKPYTRIGPYLVGLLLASYVCRRTRNNSPSLNWLTLLVGWIVASFILLTCKFGFHDQDFTNVEASFYNALIRVAFASGLGWVIFVCVVGQGGVVNSILSWKAMIPLSRITYCSYLVHRIILMIYLNSSRELIIYTDSNMRLSSV
ncbi:unnamed protein product [Larinioides sclopetarius]|uniref:Nose resistant-to-fluoxetine protein N-terminal domain-containing protein n=1 Tax=Larinioides sclopetarius TaxID=280406 RepID=A0AAV1YUA7_9ARAC